MSDLSRNFVRTFSVAMKPKVLAIFPKIHESAMKILSSRLNVVHWCQPHPPSPDKVVEMTAGCSGILVDSFTTIDKTVLAAGNNLKAVSTITVGLDHIDVGQCKAKGIRVGYTPHIVTGPTAELAVALALAACRGLSTCSLVAKGAPVTPGQPPSPWDYADLLGDGIEGSTVGIFGMGRIGLGTARRIAAFEPARILYHNRNRKSDAEATVVPRPEYVSFENLLRMSDLVIVTCALTPETTGIFDRKAFECMKDGSYFVNVSRGPVVDQGALHWALTSGKLRGAGLDVTNPEPLPPDDPLHKIPNLIILPHVGTSTRKALADMVETACRNLVAGVFDEPMVYEVGVV